MNFSPIKSLAAAWREEAALLERRGLEREARMVESFASDLEQRLREWELQELTIPEASLESGYSKSHLYTLLSEGSLSNAGTKGAPRVVRRDLPKKARTTNGGGFAERLAARQTRE